MPRLQDPPVPRGGPGTTWSDDLCPGCGSLLEPVGKLAEVRAGAAEGGAAGTHERIAERFDGSVPADALRLGSVASSTLDQRVIEHRSVVVLAGDHYHLVPGARIDDPLVVDLGLKAFGVDRG
jgi:hypothetical protein